MPRTDDEVREAFIAYLASRKDQEKVTLFVCGEEHSMRSLADAMREQREPITSEHIRMIRRLAEQGDEDLDTILQNISQGT